MGFLDALSAIGGATSGFEQGRQAKQERELKQAQTQEIKTKMSESMLSNFRQQLITHPELATNSNYVKIASNAAKHYGFQLPMTPAGGIDVDAFAPKPDILDAIGNDPTKLGQIRELPSDTQKALAKKYGDKQGLFGDFSQQVPLLPRNVQQDKQELVRAIEQLGAGGITTDQLDAIAKVSESGDPELKGTVDSIVNADPKKLAQVGLGTLAKVDRLRELGILDKDREAKMRADLGNIASVEGYRKFMEEHFGEVTQETYMRDMARIDTDNERLKDEEARTSISREHLQLSIDKAKNGGTVNTTLVQLNKDATATRSYLTTLQAQLTAARRDAKMTYADNGDDVPKAVQDHIDKLQSEVSHQTELLGDYTSHQQDIQAGILRSQGVNVKDSTGRTTEDKFPNQSKLLDAAKNVPKNQRLQVFQSSNAYKAMTADQQKAATQMIMQLP